MKKPALITSIIASLISINSYAEPHAYAFGALGQAKYKNDISSESATSFGVGGGYWFNDNFAVEGRYDDFGDVDSSNEMGINNAFNATAFAVNILAGIPLNDQFKIYAKAGISLWELDSVITANNTLSNSFSGEDFTYGFGAEYLATDYLSVGAEFTSVAVEDSNETENGGSFRVDADVSNFGIYARFNF